MSVSLLLPGGTYKLFSHTATSCALKGKTELNRTKTQKGLFQFKKGHLLCKDQLLSHHRHPQEKERGRSSSSTVGSEPTQWCNYSVCCASHLQWVTLGQERGAQGCCSPVYCTFHRTWPKPGLVSRLDIASDITHTTLSNSLALHPSQFLHLWNRAW